MSMWISVARALMALAALQRKWARELGLDGAEVFIVLSLVRAPRSCAVIATECGRQRQHVQRALRELEKRRLVTALRADDGRVHSWRLSSEGVGIARRLELRCAAWERMISPVIDLHAFERNVSALVQVLVNQRLNNGWAHALSEPFETRELFWDIPASERPWRSTAQRLAEHEEAALPRDELHQAQEAGDEGCSTL